MTCVFLRPELSEAVASFGNLPVEFQLFVNIDITAVYLADPGGQTRSILNIHPIFLLDFISGFALSASEDTTGQVKFK